MPTRLCIRPRTLDVIASSPAWGRLLPRLRPRLPGAFFGCSYSLCWILRLLDLEKRNSGDFPPTWSYERLFESSKGSTKSKGAEKLMSAILPAGTPAPDLTLHVTPDQTLSLSELRGQPVILAFYPADWS